MLLFFFPFALLVLSFLAAASPTPCPLRLHSLIRCSCRSVGAVACRYLANWRWKLPWWLQSICESVMGQCFLPAEGFDCDHARTHALSALLLRKGSSFFGRLLCLGWFHLLPYP